MRVLHFFKTYWPDSFGGVERTIDAIASSTAAHGVETTVLSLSRHPLANTLNFNGHETVKARLDLEVASTGISADVFWKFKSAAANVDLIHYHYPWPFMDLVHFCVRHGKPTIVTYHSDIVQQKFLRRLYSPLMMRFLGSVDRIVATSPRYTASSPVLARFRGKTDVIPIGIEHRGIEPGSSLLADWSSRLSRPFFLFVGVLRYYKGLHYLIEAATKTRCDIVLVGSGPLEESLKRRAAQLGAKNVHFLGALPDADRDVLLQLCLGFVFPSHLRSEAFGIALLEAAKSARPMISTELETGTSFINLHRQTGLVVPPGSADALADAMNEIAASRTTSEDWGKAARQRFLTMFTAELMGRAYANLYREVLIQRFPAPDPGPSGPV